MMPQWLIDMTDERFLARMSGGVWDGWKLTPIPQLTMSNPIVAGFSVEFMLSNIPPNTTQIGVNWGVGNDQIYERPFPAKFTHTYQAGETGVHNIRADIVPFGDTANHDVTIV